MSRWRVCVVSCLVSDTFRCQRARRQVSPPEASQDTVNIVYYHSLGPLHGRSVLGHCASTNTRVVRERVRSARLVNACWGLEHVVFPKVQYRRSSPSLPTLPRYRSSPYLTFDNFFAKKMHRDVPPLPNWTFLKEQRFERGKQSFVLTDREDNDNLLFKTRSEQVVVDVQGTGKMVMTLV